MVMAALRLQHEAPQQKREAVIALARIAARNAVRRQLQAHGVKVALLPLSVISAQANVYLRRMAPSYSRKPEPQPIAGPLRVLAKIAETEHSPFRQN
jgi:hypothetical protein